MNEQTLSRIVEEVKKRFICWTTDSPRPRIWVHENGGWNIFGKWRIRKFLEHQYPRMKRRQKMQVLARLRADLKKTSNKRHTPVIGKYKGLDVISVSCVPGATSGTDLFTFWCEHCKRHHIHGTGEGHRASHCRNRKSPYFETGYYLVESVLTLAEWEKKDREAANTIPSGRLPVKSVRDDKNGT